MLRDLTTAVILLAAIAVSLFLFAPDADGSFASFDGMLESVEVEHQGAGAIRGQHPLCHVVVLALTPVLRAAGVAAPAHIAARILSGLSAAIVLFLVVRAAGERRWYVGAGLGLVLLATREFMIDAAVGETVLPGCAAALWVLDQATRTPARLGRVWTGLVIALLIREDNVLIVPGMVAALWTGMDPAGRVVKIARGLLACAAVTLAGYGACWWLATRGEVSLWTYLVMPAIGSEWTGPLNRFPRHLDSLGSGITGRFWATSDPNIWIGPGFALALLLAAALLRGRVRVGSVGLAAGITIVVRAVFFTWWSVASPKWAALPMCLIAFVGARLAAGEPRLSLRARAAGSVLLLLLFVAPLIAHGPMTWQLRERNFIDVMRRTVQEGRGCRFIAHGPNVGLALEFLEVPHVKVGDIPDPRVTLAEITREVHQHPVKTMVVMDRWMLSNDPLTTQQWRKAPMFLDDLVSTPELRILREEGLAYAVRYDPNAPK